MAHWFVHHPFSRLSFWILLICAMLVPMRPLQAQGRPSLTNVSDYEAPLCQYGYITYLLTLTNPEGNPDYTASLQNTIPANTNYVVGSVSPEADYNSSANRIEWSGELAAGEAISVSFVVTVGLTVPDTTILINAAVAVLKDKAGTTTLEESVRDAVDCNVAAATPEAWEIIPAGTTFDEETEEETLAPMLPSEALDDGANLESSELFTDTTTVGDESPVGWYVEMFLPSLWSDSDELVVNTQTEASTTAQDEGPRRVLPCAAVPPWGTSIGMDEATYVQNSIDLGEAGLRPISITGNGTGADARFSTIWVKDGLYADNWILRHKLTGAEYQSNFEDFGKEGFVPIVLDAYGKPSDPRYAAIWIKENKAIRGTHGVSRETMQDLIQTNLEDNYRPLWFTGLSNGDNTQFSGLWVRDSFTGTAGIDLTSTDISDQGLAQTLTDKGYRLQQISAYDTPDGRRYAATWVLDTDCPERRWEAFRDQNQNQYVHKAMVQTPILDERTVANGVITLKAADFAARRYIRIAMTHGLDFGATAILREIKEAVPGVFQNGDIVILSVVPNLKVRAEEGSIGNLRLRPWQAAYTGPGQSFLMDSHQYRLILRYDAATQKWVEMQRNNLSPDYYYPISLDEGGEPDNRDYASVWLAGPTQRVFDPTSIQTAPLPGPDPLADFDTAMREHMERRGIPAGSLAVAKDGKLVFAKAYKWDLPGVFSASPMQGYRLASMSKPLTAVAILRLVQNGALNLDWKIKDIPGFDAAVLSSNLWIDARIKEVTVRELLHHLGGWDRDVSFDPMISDFNACSFTNPDALPTTAQGLINWMRSQNLDHKPGWVYAYSNFGYNLLGRIIEVVSGKSYNQYMQDTIFGPLGMSSLKLTKNLSTEPWPNEVFYYTPNNTIEDSNLGFAGNFPGRDICTPSHADVVPSPYGGLNLLPMDSHGGWIANAPDLARFLVDMESSSQVLGLGYRNLMWSRPDGRSRRVGILKGLSTMTDYTIAARIKSSLTFPGPANTDEWLLLTKGLSPFTKIVFEIDVPGNGYDLRFFYSGPGGVKELTAEDHDLVDGTAGLTQDGNITFTAPDDWAPSNLGGFDGKPRYVIVVTTNQEPTTVAEIDYALPAGEATYGLGWDTTENVIGLPVAFGLPFYTPGTVIVGTKSKASAVVLASVPLNIPLPNATLIVMNSLAGGPFAPGENLFVGNAYVGKALGRDTAGSATASHGGLLWGTRTWFVHRNDKINYVVLFNQDNHGAYYLPNEGRILGAIEDVIDDVNAANAWPNIDLFP